VGRATGKRGMETGRAEIRNFKKQEVRSKKLEAKNKKRIILPLVSCLLPLVSCLLHAPVYSADNEVKGGYRNDYLPKGIVPKHEMDSAENWIAIFEHPKRDEWQEPDKVIEI